jgi:signal transduction histidine kinase
LIVIKGADEGKQFELAAAPLSIGRDSGNPICLHDTEVSRRHAEVRPDGGGGYRIRDVGSVNGTLVNTRPVEDGPLRPGDHIQLGQTVLVFSAGRTESPPSSELAERIRMIPRQESDLPSAIIRTIAENEGSRILARPDQAGTPWLRTRLANLGIMYETVQAVSHILDLDQLLERIMELIFRSIEADRGCIMLRDPDTGHFEPKAVRYREGVNRQEKIGISRTIMEHVLRERQGVLVADAAQDQRFNTGQSILRLQIREAICVPMKGRHETLGVLYLDTQTATRDLLQRGENQPVRFSEDHLALAIAIAHQAALAVEETRYHQALVNAERLAAVGQTIAALSHHIKNILQGLDSGSHVLKTGLAERDDAMIQHGWRIVEKNQRKIYDLVLDMLSYSKEREPVIEPTDLNRLVVDVAELMKGRTLDLGAKVVLHLRPGLPVAPVDPEGIHRALLNVVGNALDAVEGREAPRVDVQTLLEDEGAWARIVVMDNGVGIPAERLGEIFRPFVSSKGARGTGLGLAVSRKILREHGGDILVESIVGTGSKFVLRVPMKSPFVADPPTGTDMAPPEPPAPS